MQSETILPMPDSLASLLISEKEQYEKIQKLKKERDYLLKKIRYRFSHEGRKQMEQMREEAMKSRILGRALFKYAILVKYGLIQIEDAARAMQELYEELGIK